MVSAGTGERAALTRTPACPLRPYPPLVRMRATPSPVWTPPMPRLAAQRRPQQTSLTPRVKVWLEAGGRYAVGLGISEILQAVDRARSIKRAACDLGKSYRHVWSRIKAAEDALGRRL